MEIDTADALIQIGLPILALLIAGWLVPALLARALPEGVPGLIVNGVLSTAILGVLSAALFVWLYGPGGQALWQVAPVHFLLLGARAALIWAPVMVLSLANRPRHWVHETW